MEPNLNFYNEFEVVIKPENRNKAIAFLQKMNSNKPGLTELAKVSLDLKRDAVNIYILNMEAFDSNTRKIVLKYLSSLS